DDKYNSYVLYLKFGDAKDESRHKAYSTHNPSFVFAHRSDGEDDNMGKAMQALILQTLNHEYEAKFSERPDFNQMNSIGSSGTGKGMMSCLTLLNEMLSPFEAATEWYEVYLGSNAINARKCKSKLSLLLDKYAEYDKDSAEYGGLSRLEFIQKFRDIIHGCAAKAPQDAKYEQKFGKERVTRNPYEPTLSPETQNQVDRIRKSQRLVKLEHKKVAIEIHKSSGAGLTAKLKAAGSDLE
ncbi:hypothetical protein H0H87_005331, partial [Tephrocybe sp. NHM501043]